ncbi:MAG: type III glutamate--ammonia ligase [Frankia sp.]
MSAPSPFLITDNQDGSPSPDGRVTPAGHEADAVAALLARGVRYAAVSFVDLHGKTKAKMVPIGHLEHATTGSELFTGAALDGVPQDVSDEEVSAHPDLAGAIVLPWQPEIAWIPSDLYLAGKPFAACSRIILGRVMADAAELGLVPQLGIETEFYVLRDHPDGPVPLAASDTLDKPCYDLRSLLHSFPVVDEIVSAMNELGWDVYSFDHEDGNGQFETDFSYTNALGMADRLTFFRLMVGEITARHDCFASFMPKPFGNLTGSGAHYNMSMADPAGLNLFADPDDPRGCGLSELGYHFVAGILRHAPAVCAAVAPTVNSYKRLVRRSNSSGFTWAPIFACYGDNNRTNMLRIPLGGGRVECRAADSAANPYLGAALIFAAGLEGIRERLDPGEPNRDNMYLLSPAELAARNINHLPRTLLEAVEALAADPLAQAVFGPEMLGSFVDEKLAEWESYHAHVSDWERDRYLRFF